jgi:hypothetical protein
MIPCSHRPFAKGIGPTSEPHRATLVSAGATSGLFIPSFIWFSTMKSDRLPRQARDTDGRRRRERKALFARVPCVAARLLFRTALVALLNSMSGKKTGILSHLYIKVIFLPRQARDKHRENSKKSPFSRRPQHNPHRHDDVLPAGKKRCCLRHL